MELFYTPNFAQSNFTLSPDESNHCINVLRHKINDNIAVTDGNGKLFSGKIAEAHHKRCRIDVLQITETPPLAPYLHIAIAPTKSIERLEWFLEKATEIGINEITPLLCNHSERRQIRLDRLEKVTVAAMKQSQKFFAPQLNELTPFSNFINTSANGLKCIAHCADQTRTALKELVQTAPNRVTILIGPEGDFSQTEIEQAMTQGYKGISLGDSRLRTETAGVVACHTVRLLL